MVLLFSFFSLHAQNEKDSIVPKHYQTEFTIGTSVLGGGSLGYLATVWYKPGSGSAFHTFNDWPEWGRMDKIGHACTSFWIAEGLHTLALKSGFSASRSRWLAAGIPMAYMTGIEVMDGFSKDWGFSWGDMAANASGLSLFLLEQHFPAFQHLQLKYSYKAGPWNAYRTDVFGTSVAQRMLKNYNEQTYWLSISLHPLWPTWPNWLGLALGYSIEGYVGGRDNQWINQGQLIAYPEAWRSPEFCMSLDLNLVKLSKKYSWLKPLATGFGWIKIPFPTVVWQSGKLPQYRWTGW